MLIMLCVAGMSSSVYAQSFTTAQHRPARRASAKSQSLVGARAAILMDGQTGAILYEKNAFKQMDPASLTKMMTALLTIEQGHLNKVVTVSKRADRTGGSSLHIGAGQQYTVLDLLRGLLLRSGNDASIALAEAEAGSVEKFVARMNMKAQELGAFNTSFENPNGLTAPGHYSSAYDLALIARAALKRPLFQALVGSQEERITEIRRKHTRTIHNTNRLLYGFPGANGVKTGTTDAAGRCLVASATRDGRQLIAVVLHSPNRWQDAGHLLNWGFSHWTNIDAVYGGQNLARIPVQGGRELSVPVKAASSLPVSVPDHGSYHVVLSVPSVLKAPVKARPVGHVFVLGENQPPGQTLVLAAHAVPRKLVHRKFWDWIRHTVRFLR